MDNSNSSPIAADAIGGSDAGPSLGRQMAKGAAWMVFMQIAIRAIGLISMVVLARLLVPADFGLVALAMMVYGLLDVFGQFGFDVVLIQNQQADREHYDTAWTLTVIRNTVMAVLLVAGAPFAADFFDEPRLQAIFYWLALAAFIQGFANIGVVNFRKELKFHKDFIFMVGAKLGSFAVVLPLAFVWRNYWALVVGVVAGSLIRVAIGYAMQPYRPHLCLAKWRDIMNFSKWLITSNVLAYLQNRTDILIVGKISASAGVGLYSIAYEISNLATTELISPIRRAILPGYSTIAADAMKLRQGFLKSTAVIIAVGAPVAAGIGLTADLFVPLVLGRNWLESIPLIQILAISGLFQVGTAATSPVLIATGKPMLITVAIGCSVVMGLPVMIWAGLQWGVIGVAWGTVWASTVLSILFLTFGARAVGINGRQIISAIWRSLVSVAVMTLIVRVLITSLPEAQSFYHLLGTLFFVTFLGGVSYIGLHLALWQISGAKDDPERYILETMRSALNFSFFRQM